VKLSVVLEKSGKKREKDDQGDEEHRSKEKRRTRREGVLDWRKERKEGERKQEVMESFLFSNIKAEALRGKRKEEV